MFELATRRLRRNKFYTEIDGAVGVLASFLSWGFLNLPPSDYQGGEVNS